MHTFIAAHADQIVAISSVVYIYMASSNVFGGLKPWTFDSANAQHKMRNDFVYLVELVLLITLTILYVYAAGYASPRVGTLFGFTNLYCIALPIIKKKFKTRTRNGYTLAGIWVSVLVIAGALTVFAPLSPK